MKFAKLRLWMGIATILISCAAHPKNTQIPSSAIKKLDKFFEIYDKNKDGKLSFAEFYRSCEDAKASYALKNCKYYFDLYDKKHNGLVDKKEFIEDGEGYYHPS